MQEEMGEITLAYGREKTRGKRREKGKMEKIEKEKRKRRG